MKKDTGKPFTPPGLPVDIDYIQIIKEIGMARSSIGELAGLLINIKNPGLLTIPLLTNEAVLSSRIEGTIATVEDVFLYEAQDSKKEESEKEKDIQEIINYRRAIEYALKELPRKPVSENFIKKLHHILMDSVRGANKSRGNFRNTQVYIGKHGSPLEEATYIPPVASKIPELFSNWEKYFHSDKEIDELVQLGIIHYQFEAIHPFLDGNGRIGRLLIPLFLFERKFLPFPLLYISAYFEKNRREYYKRLNEVSKKHDWIGWLKFFLIALHEQAIITKEKVTLMVELYERTKITVGKIHSVYAIELLDIIHTKPIVTYNSIKNKIGASPQTIYNLIEKFCELGILEESPGKKRNKSYVFSELLRII